MTNVVARVTNYSAAKVSDFVRILPSSDGLSANCHYSGFDSAQYGVARITQVQRSRNYCAHDVDVYCINTTVLSGVSSLNEEKESSDNESEHLKYRKLTDICRVFLLLFVTESLMLCSDFLLN